MTRAEALALVQDLVEACIQREHAGSTAQYIKDDADFATKLESVVVALSRPNGDAR